MYLLYASRAFANRGGDPFDATGTNVAYSKDSRNIGLKEFWPTPVQDEIFCLQIRPGSYESAVIECDATVEPVSGRYGAGHEENVTDVVQLRFALRCLPCYPLEVLIAIEGLDLCGKMKSDIRGFCDASNEVLRHTRRQPLRSNQ